jgi:hypothetical protein
MNRHYFFGSLIKKKSTMKQRKNEEKKQQPDPIIDGDARPDMPLTPEDKNFPDKDNKKGKTTINRVDNDTREDFKDAKLE